MAFVGNLDEDSKLPELNFSSYDSIVLNFEQIHTINSCGIRAWMQWMATFPSSIKIIFIRCPRDVINAINMVDGFAPSHVEVQSAFVPYFCNSCKSEQKHLVTEKDVFDESGQISISDVVPCEKCQKDAEIDIIEQTYLKSLRKKTS